MKEKKKVIAIVDFAIRKQVFLTKIINHEVVSLATSTVHRIIILDRNNSTFYVKKDLLWRDVVFLLPPGALMV